MATEEIKNAAHDAVDAVTEAVGSAKDAVVDAAEAVSDDATEHAHAVDTVQETLQARAEEREESARRAAR